MAAPISGIKHAESRLYSREEVQRKVPQGNNQINNYSMVDRGFLSWLISSTEKSLKCDTFLTHALRF